MSRRGRWRAARTFHPNRQGQLDGLCGLYAIINAVRLPTHDRTGEFGHGVWRELLLALLGEAENVVGTATAVVHGIGAKPLYELAKAAERHLASEHGVAVTVSFTRSMPLLSKSSSESASTSCGGALS